MRLRTLQFALECSALHHSENTVWCIHQIVRVRALGLSNEVTSDFAMWLYFV